MSKILDVLHKMSCEELNDLMKVFDESYSLNTTSSTVLLEEKILPFLRQSTGADQNLPIEDVIKKSLCITAKVLKLEIFECSKVSEDELIETIFAKYKSDIETKLKNLKLNKRIEFLREWEKQIKKSSISGEKKTMATGASIGLAIGAGNFAGFGIFLGLTTLLKAISLALGIVFPFLLYQIAVIILSILLGPVGWSIAGIIFLYGGVNYILKKNHPKVACIILSSIMKVMELKENQGEAIGGVDPYCILGIESSASNEEIKNAYRSIIERIHPDIDLQAEESYKESQSLAEKIVEQAYEIIKKERDMK